MKKFLSLSLAVLLIMSCVALAVSAFEIVLPDDEFGEEEVVYEPGDANGDGSIDNLDYSLLFRIIKGVSYDGVGNPDVDGDESYTNTDRSTLKRVLKGA